MKKSSLMGASVVAAALLAAAPVVAPAASLATPATQVVKADAVSDRDNAIGRFKDLKSNRDLTTADATTELVDFKEQFSKLVPKIANKDFYGDSSDGNPYVISDDDNSVKTSTGEDLVGLKYFTDGSVNTFDTPDITKAAKKLHYKITFKYSNAIGVKTLDIGSKDDAERAYSNMIHNGGTITMTTTFDDGYGKVLDSFESTVTYKVDNSAAAYVHYNDQLNASVNDSADQYGLVNSFANAGGSIIDKKGNDLLQTAVNNGAVTVGKLRKLNTNNDNTADGNPNEEIDGNFADEGTYYQHIVINLDKLKLEGGAAAAYNRGDVTVNGLVPSSTNVDANAYFAKNAGSVDGFPYDANSLILKRVVKVGPANVVAKDEKVSGIVTVHTSDITTAPLYDEAGKVIVDRSLINNSQWKTDTKRTVLASGKVFYRVSTHEYVSADQVTFEPTDTSSSADVVKGDVVVTPLPSIKIIQASYAGSVTDLWNKSDDNKSMTRSADRHLAGGTLWKTDKTATVNGVTYYRVSTNEWIPAKYILQ